MPDEMMIDNSDFVAVGINHKTAPIEIREQYFLTVTQQDLVLSELRREPNVFEAFVLSTCNRTEVYARVMDPAVFYDTVLRLLGKLKGRLPAAEGGLFYRHDGRKAIEHLLEVITGLDSLVLGEKQILGQVKTAMQRVQEAGGFSRAMNILANMAVRTGKQARNETMIGFGGSSVSWAAVMTAENLLGSLEDKTFAIIGAGKMGEMTLDQISNKRIRRLLLINRTQSVAENLAGKFLGTAVPFCDIKEALSEADVCVCAAGAPHYIIEPDLIRRVRTMRAGRKLILIDISVPRNINPLVKNMPGVYLTDIDDLDKFVGETMQIRQKAVPEVRDIIETKLCAFYGKLHTTRPAGHHAVRNR